MAVQKNKKTGEDRLSNIERSDEGNTRNYFAWPSDTDADSVAQKVEQRRVDTEAEVERLTRQLAGAVRALELLLPWADGPDEDWMSADDIARRAVALRTARDLIGGQ